MTSIPRTFTVEKKKSSHLGKKAKWKIYIWMIHGCNSDRSDWYVRKISQKLYGLCESLSYRWESLCDEVKIFYNTTDASKSLIAFFIISELLMIKITDSRKEKKKSKHRLSYYTTCNDCKSLGDGVGDAIVQKTIDQSSDKSIISFFANFIATWFYLTRVYSQLVHWKRLFQLAVMVKKLITIIMLVRIIISNEILLERFKSAAS